MFINKDMNLNPKYVLIPMFMSGWYYCGTLDINSMKQAAWDYGREFSARVAYVPGWNSLVEPLIVSQCARLSVVVYSFVQGLTSDNTNRISIDSMKDIILDAINSEQETERET